MTDKTRKLVITAMLTALAVITLMVPFLRTPLLPAAPFLEYDAMDVPIMIGALLLGPGAGVTITVIASIIQGITVSGASGIYGIIQHIIATSAFVSVTAFIYHRNKNEKFGLLIALIAGTVAMAVIMIPANLIVTPFFMGTPVSAVVSMIIPIIIPFNHLKAGINSVIVYILYPTIKKIAKM